MHVRSAIASATVIVTAVVAWSPAPFAQGAAPQAPAAGQAPPAGQGRGGGGGVAFGPPTMKTPYDDYTGFTKIFDGKTFTNWLGEMDVWSIEDGLLHADTTKTPGQHHLHYVGPGAVMRDFTLKVEVKLSATGANGGIQYRSRLLHPAHGGSIADPLGKPLPANITTMDQAVAAGITAAPAARGGGPGGGAPGGGGGRAGARRLGHPVGAALPAQGGAPGGRPGGPGAAAPADANGCVGEVGRVNAPASPAGRGAAPGASRPAIPGR